MVNIFFLPSKSVDYLRFGALLNNMITCLLHGQAIHTMCFSVVKHVGYKRSTLKISVLQRTRRVSSPRHNAVHLYPIYILLVYLYMFPNIDVKQQRRVDRRQYYSKQKQATQQEYVYKQEARLKYVLLVPPCAL